MTLKRKSLQTRDRNIYEATTNSSKKKGISAYNLITENFFIFYQFYFHPSSKERLGEILLYFTWISKDKTMRIFRKRKKQATI